MAWRWFLPFLGKKLRDHLNESYWSVLFDAVQSRDKRSFQFFLWLKFSVLLIKCMKTFSVIEKWLKFTVLIYINIDLRLLDATEC